MLMAKGRYFFLDANMRMAKGFNLHSELQNPKVFRDNLPHLGASWDSLPHLGVRSLEFTLH
jgi:hypothetical protein